MQLQFAVDGQMQLSRKLESVGANVQDWSSAFEQSGDMLLDIFSNDVFDTEGQAIDESWDPLSRAYAAMKEKKYPGTGILQATGKMRNSFTKLFDSTSLVMGNAMTYFKYHQSSEPRQKLPRRVMLKLNDDMKESVVRIFQEELLLKMQM